MGEEKPAKLKPFRLSYKRQKEILSALASAAMERMGMSEIIHSYETGSTGWKHLFADAPQSEEVVIFYEAMSEGNITDEEMDYLMEPFFARELQKALGCNSMIKKVIIKW